MPNQGETHCIKSATTRANAEIWNNLVDKRAFVMYLLRLNLSDMNKTKNQDQVNEVEAQFKISLDMFNVAIKPIGEPDFIKYPEIQVSFSTDGQTSDVVDSITGSLKSDVLPSALLTEFRREAEMGDYYHTIATAFKWFKVVPIS